MPQRPEFDLNSSTIAPVYGRVGVLEFEDFKQEVIGAYYDRDPQFAGIYAITATGIKYFDVPVEEIVVYGSTGYVEFSVDGVLHLIRELDEEDGMWMSAYKTELPVSVLQQMVIARSMQVIDNITDLEIPQPLPEFEAMYIYYSPDSDAIHSIVYMSSYGIFSRNDASWNPVDLGVPEMQKLITEDVNPSNANALINLFDDNAGIMSVKQALKYTIKVKD